MTSLSNQSVPVRPLLVVVLQWSVTWFTVLFLCKYSWFIDCRWYTFHLRWSLYSRHLPTTIRPLLILNNKPKTYRFPVPVWKARMRNEGRSSSLSTFAENRRQRRSKMSAVVAGAAAAKSAAERARDTRKKLRTPSCRSRSSTSAEYHLDEFYHKCNIA